MEMKTNIIIEQFDNGIAITNINEDGSISKTVSLDHSKESDIGKELWSDIKYIMDKSMCDKVKMEINYAVVDGK